MTLFVKLFSVALSFLCFTLGLSAQTTIPEQFNAMGQRPRTVFFTNTLPLNEEGGHLQGIQVDPSGADSFVLSGSSSTYAYYLTVAGNEVTRVVELGQKPMKHAGGFQLSDGYLAVGVEDNNAKDKSEVAIYQVDGPEIQAKPSWVIHREGDVMRATAGAVGLARDGNELLIVVGDWDVQNLDFYRIDLQSAASAPESPFNTLVTKDLLRKEWVNDSWYPYQNINLIREDDGRLYLVGLGTDVNGQNIADLYELSINDGGCNLKKISSKIFPSDSAVSFRAGAGIYKGKDGKLHVISCGNHVGRAAIIQIWE